ncbi:hypothetical protein XH89_14410 [Bradyrhizobium sp. CCBAU 53340]|nr:hypothetical protein XH89_14410 [Bradyrhizobium sp. CCBAU 53340]
MITRPQQLGEHFEQGSRDTIDLAKGAGVEAADPMGVKQSDEQEQSGKSSHSRPSRLEEARRATQEYVEDLREILRKLRARLLN